MTATTPTSCPASVLVVPEYWEQPHLQGSIEGGVGRGSTAWHGRVGQGAGAGPRILRLECRSVVGWHHHSGSTYPGAQSCQIGPAPVLQSGAETAHRTHGSMRGHGRMCGATGREIAGDIIS